jgi:hypothetical protein
MRSWTKGAMQLARKFAKLPKENQTSTVAELMASLEATSDIEKGRDLLTAWMLSQRGLAIAREDEGGVSTGTPLTRTQRNLIRMVEPHGYRVRLQ